MFISVNDILVMIKGLYVYIRGKIQLADALRHSKKLKKCHCLPPNPMHKHLRRGPLANVKNVWAISELSMPL